MLYTQIMNCLKKSCIHFLFFSFFLTIPCSVCLANPGQEEFPPLPPDQDKPFFENPELPARNPDKIINYRGNRVYKDNAEAAFGIINISCERLDENAVTMEVVFNQSINPRSITHESIFINQKPLDPDTHFLFNRKGNIIKLKFYTEEDTVICIIQKILSFDGNPLPPTKAEVEIFSPQIITEPPKEGEGEQTSDSDLNLF